MIDKQDRIYVSGHTGLVGSTVVRKLERNGYRNLLLRSRTEVELTNEQSVRELFRAELPDCVIHCAAKVGSIQNKIDHPAEFLYENLQIQNNVIWQAKEFGVQKLLFVGSSCLYPEDCPQPMREEEAMGGIPGEEDEAYAYAKRMGAKLCDYVRGEFGLDFFTGVPTNIYGGGDNFDPRTAHVIPALIHRFHRAKAESAPEVVVWGNPDTGREFLHVEDLADAIVWLLEHQIDTDYVNIGTGMDVPISDLAESLKDIIGYRGTICFDSSRPSGRPRRVLDVSRLTEMGWQAKIGLREGLERTYEWYLSEVAV